MRLSTLAANVIAEYLHSQDERVLRAYLGTLFRARFTSRLWMRKIAAPVRHRGLTELGCAHCGYQYSIVWLGKCSSGVVLFRMSIWSHCVK